MKILSKVVTFHKLKDLCILLKNYRDNILDSLLWTSVSLMTPRF